MTFRLRLVLDTNVVASAFLWQGTPVKLIDLAIEKEAHLFTSKVLLDEWFFRLLSGLSVRYRAGPAREMRNRMQQALPVSVGVEESVDGFASGLGHGQTAGGRAR